MNEPIIRTDNLCKSFMAGGRRQEVLAGVNLEVRAGETIAIAGASGSGKTTLLHLLGGLERPSCGTAWLDGESWAAMTATAAAVARNKKLGFIFQFHLLLPEFSAVENAAMPLFIRGMAAAAATAAARLCLEQLGVGALADKTPDKLSGGERQRVAVARALAGRPACILADEPTGNLDRRNADAVFSSLLEAASAQNTAIIVASHDERLIARAGRRARLIDGVLVEG